MQQNSKLVCSRCYNDSFISIGAVSGVTDEEELAVELRNDSKAFPVRWPDDFHFRLDLVAMARLDYVAQQKINPSEPKIGGMEQTIYIHVVCLGESLFEKPQRLTTGLRDARNDWYAIRQGSDGCLQMLRVFEDINQFNYPDPVFDATGCQVIGSCIYVIGGRFLSHYIGSNHRGSSLIRCLDTRSPRNGWTTLPLTLPFEVHGVASAVVDGQWLYLLGGFRNSHDLWGYALNVASVDGHGKNEDHEARTIVKPGISSLPPVFATSFSPGTLVAYQDLEGESTLYHLDCTNNVWTVYDKDLPYRPSRRGGGFAASDGILYLYDSSEMQFIAYDIPNRNLVYVVKLPTSFWFGCRERIKLIVLAKNKFCIIWHQGDQEPNQLVVYYVRFSVSFDYRSEATIVTEDKQFFHIPGCKIVNVVAVDPQQIQQGATSAASAEKSSV